MPVTTLSINDGGFLASANDLEFILPQLNTMTSDSWGFNFGDTLRNNLIVAGNIVASNAGVTGRGTDYSVVVLSSGSVSGDNGMDMLFSDNVDVVNHGDINGYDKDGVQFFQTNGENSVVNTGRITATDLGIEVFNTEADLYTMTINNSGTVFGGNAAIDGADGVETVYNSGILLGDVLLFGGDDRIDTRSGLVSGEIDLGGGNDVAIGSQEDDTIIAGAGDDIVRAGGDDDTVTGGDGNDILRGAGGDDDLRGEDDDDLIFGGTGDDVIRGNTGNDELRGGTGDDRVAGGSGDDEIHGGRGDDTLTGNSGADVFVFNASAGNDTITDFRVNLDMIDLSALGTRFNRVDAATEVVNGNAIIDLDMLGGDGTIVVRGVGGNLDANDFLF